MKQVSHNSSKAASVNGRTLFDFADELAVLVPTSCGRMGHCHECIVEVTSGLEALSPPTEAESFLRGNYRLACQAVISNPEVDVVFSPLRRRPRILTAPASEKPVEMDATVTRRHDRIFYNGEELDRYRGHVYGVAIDLGTTTIVMELVDLETGSTVAVASFENPQRFGGSDVMNRISYDSGPGRGELQKAVI